MEQLVDIIIPTYKRADMLEKAIDSILNQSYRNVLVTVVDDNDPSSEWRSKTSSMMCKYGSNKRVQYICHEKNKNGSAARNTGLKHTNGDFVCFLDDDDYFLEDKVRLQVNYLLNNINMGACYCDYIKNGEEIHLNNQMDFSHDILLGLQTPQTSGIMFRREVINDLYGFDESYYRHQDYELLLRFYDKYLMGKVDEVLYVRERSTVDNNPNGFKLEKLKVKMLNQFDYKLKAIEERETGYYRQVIVYNYIDVMKSYMKQKSIKNSIRVLLIALSNDIALTIKLLYISFFNYNKNKKMMNNYR
ncbi:glycosyltransferase family 2 protein [Anaerocolumna aminovalerica]|uniref:glycosyltransferase family 2 protein n=1 Tax=Anaerocolumna aminovalerica TaxID=1527 RepID=UPI00248CC998|nr:glycosyltransferase family A protein [Anaerocolumna aminovalerica]